MTSAGELRRKALGTLTRPSYSLANRDMVLLNDNANLFGTNPAVAEVVEGFDFSRLWAYPSENSDALRSRIASEFGVTPEEVIVGNGSDELLDMTAKAFIDPGDSFCSPSPTFGMYKFYARVNLATICEKLLRPDFSMDVEGMISEGAKLTAICQPNNPTANLFDKHDVLSILSESPGVVILDEAYCDFCDSDMLADAMAAPLTIDIRTMSKAYGLAGLRAGFAIARKEVIDELRRVRTPFGLNSFTEAVATRALDHRRWVRDTVASMKVEMEYLDGKLRGLGFKTYPSECNFLIAKCPVNGPALVSSLRERGVAVRDCNSFPLMQDHIRVTIGPRVMMDRFLAEVEPVVGRGAP
jgi:histidinol-phosphate aminotransferase